MKKVLFPLIALVLVLGLALPMAGMVEASPDTIWMIGSFDGSNTEFYVGSEDETGETAYTIGDPVVDFPRGLKHSSSGRTDCLYPESVTISFDTTVDYVNVNLRYSRMGGEENEVELDGSPLGTCAGPVDPNPATDYNFPVSGILSAGSHTVEITCTDGGNGSPDGAHYIDALELTGDPFVVTKELSASDGYLGDTISVTLEVENPSGSTLTVTDELPDGLKYIPGSLYLDTTLQPDPEGDIVSVSIPPGDYTVTFNVQVVEVQCTNTTATNWAYLYDDVIEVASDSANITLWPYEGFTKEIEWGQKKHGEEWYDLPDPTVVPIGTDIKWLVVIGISNVLNDNITTMRRVVVQDRLGGDLEVLRCVPSTSVGPVKQKLSGKTEKVHLTWPVTRSLADNASESLSLVISTDINPGTGNGKKPGHQEYTSPGWHELNSGAVVKFIDDESEGGTGFQLSAHTPALAVYVPDAMLELENKYTSNWTIIEDDTYGELHYNTSGDEFYFVFQGYGLELEEDYSLIYYADFDPRFTVWGGNNPGALIGTGTASGGNLTMSGSIDLGMDLPSSPDWNINPDPDYCDLNNGFDDYDHCSGAKIWLVPSDCLTGSTDLPVVVWAPTRFLFETDLITYTDTNAP